MRQARAIAALAGRYAVFPAVVNAVMMTVKAMMIAAVTMALAVMGKNNRSIETGGKETVQKKRNTGSSSPGGTKEHMISVAVRERNLDDDSVNSTIAYVHPQVRTRIKSDLSVPPKIALYQTVLYALRRVTRGASVAVCVDSVYGDQLRGVRPTNEPAVAALWDQIHQVIQKRELHVTFTGEGREDDPAKLFLDSPGYF